MILNKEKKEVDTFLSVNNDIYRMVKALDKDDMLKKLLVNTDNKPLQGTSVEKSLIDKQITRVALLPYDDEEGSIVNITMINGTLNHNTNTFNNTLAVDVFTPGNQWIINEGVRPLMIAHTVDNIIRSDFNQTDGVKYRLVDIINAQLSDVLIGYRLIYIAVIDD
jgi:hypothetical protein